MTSENLKAWQTQIGYTYEQAAAELGIARSTYAKYVQLGAPKYIGLACAALAANLAANLDANRV
jgi:transcriptional regulator with XRE-family HTH domain